MTQEAMTDSKTLTIGQRYYILLTRSLRMNKNHQIHKIPEYIRLRNRSIGEKTPSVT